MYKAKITNLEDTGGYLILKDRKVGDIIEFCDERLSGLRRFVQVIEHYKMITTSKERCKHCGSWIIKRKKDILNY